MRHIMSLKTILVGFFFLAYIGRENGGYGNKSR